MRCPRLIARLVETLPSLALAASLALVACAPVAPRDIHYGEEACGYCRMTITDRRFGAQATSPRGRVEVFDSIECLADWANATPRSARDAAPRAWAADFLHPGTFIPVDSARFVRLARASSPMGAGLAAVRASAPHDAVATDGPPMTWEEVLASRRVRSAAGGAHAD